MKKKQAAKTQPVLVSEEGSASNQDDSKEISLDYPPYTQEAWEWMINQESIPGAFSPYMYIGPGKTTMIAEALGRSIELDEAQFLVQPDGDKVKCAASGVTFQPVKYMAYVPKGLSQWLEGDKRLTDIRFRYGGQFYVHQNGKDMIPVSGSPYHVTTSRSTREPEVTFNSGSPLNMFHAKTGQWAVILDDVEAIILKKAAKNGLKKKVDEMSRLVMPMHRGGDHRKGLDQVGDALKNIGKIKSKKIDKPNKKSKD